MTEQSSLTDYNENDWMQKLSPVWFSHKEYWYDVQKKSQRSFSWNKTKDSQIWDWNNCTVSAVSMPEDRVRIIIRSKQTVDHLVKKNAIRRFMYGFDVAQIPEPELGNYKEPIKNIPKKQGPEKPRWTIHLRKDEKDDRDNKDCCIWEWANGRKKEETAVYQIYRMLKKRQENPDFSRKEIFHTPTVPNDDIIPVVYQPAIDSWENFVEQIQCHKLDDKGNYEVTIVLKGEHLRKHSIFEWIYRKIRKELYHRLKDVETFRILSSHGEAENFMFSAIYSNDHNIEDDDIHGDKPWFFQKIPIHSIKYYFSSRKHPIVFINTSNHAMAEHDNNHNLWKWEYVAWEKNSPIVFGNKSREQIEMSLQH